MIRFGDEGMRRELAALWRECFGDPEEYANLFFDNHPPKSIRWYLWLGSVRCPCFLCCR